MWILLIISSVAPPVAEPLPPGAIARLGSTRWLVGENARGLVASPDGRQVMIGRPVGLRIFDARSGEVAEHLTEPQAYHLTALDWHADKALVRSQTLTEKIWLFDVKRSVGLVGLEVPQACLSNDGQLVHTIVDGAFYSYEIQTQRWSRIGSLGEQPSNREQMLIANPKRRELAVALLDHHIGVLDLRTGKFRWQVRAHSPRSHSFREAYALLAYSPEGDWLASGGQDGNVRLWHAQTGKPGPVLGMGQAPVVALHWSKQGHLAVAYAKGSLELYSGRKRLWSRRPAKHWWNVTMCVADEGRTLFVHSAQQTRLLRWDVQTGEPRPENPASRGSIQDVRWSDEDRVTTVDTTGQVIQWNVRNCTGKKVLVIGSSPAALSANGRLLLRIGDDLNEAQLVDLETGRVLRTTPLPRKAYFPSLTLSRDGRQFVITEQGFQYADVFYSGDPPRGKSWFKTVNRSEGGAAVRLAFSPSGSMLVEAAASTPLFKDGAYGGLRVLDSSTGTVRAKLPEGIPIRAEFDPSGKCVIALIEFSEKLDGLIFWDFQRPERSIHVKRGLISTNNFDVSQCGRLVVLANADWSNDRAIQVWERRTGSKVCQVGQGKPLQGLRFSPEGRRVLTDDHEGELLLWDITGRLQDRTGALRPTNLDAIALENCWGQLASKDASVAYNAAWLMASDPTRASRFLAKRLSPVDPTNAVLVAKLLEELDSEDYRTRQNADQALRALGKGILSHTGPVLPRLSLEARRRLERIERALDDDPRMLRNDRALFALEQMGEPGRALLYRIAEGVPEAEITQLARAALNRRK